MTDSLVPESLDMRKAFSGQTEIEGIWPVRSMPRLQGYLSSDRGEARVRLTLSRDAEWRRIVEGEVAVTVDVTCERCLESYSLTLEEPVLLAVVESEGLAERLPDEIEPWLTEGDTLRVSDIVEDQLILAMPIVTRHAGDCMQAAQKAALREADEEPPASASAGNAGEPERENPFAVLEALKKTDR